MTKFVDAYSKTTGNKQVIPERWLSLNFPPFNDFRRTPLARSKEAIKPKTTKTESEG